jgi:hypothetical protein
MASLGPSALGMVVSSRSFLWLNLYFGVGVATLGVGVPMSYPLASRSWSSLRWRPDNWHRDARRLFARIVSYVVPRLLLAQFAFRSRHWVDRRRDAQLRFSIVVSNSIWRLTCAKRGVFWRRQDGRRRDAWRRLSNVVSNGLQRFICAKYGFLRRRRFCYFVSIGVTWIICAKNGVLWQLRDARRRFASVLSCGFPRIKYALYGILSLRRWDDRRRFAIVVSFGFSRLMCIIYGILSPRRDDRCGNAGRRFANVLSCAFSNLMYAIYWIICRCLDARCRFVTIVSYVVSMLLLAWFGIEVGIATVHVATLSVGSIMSCRRASRGLSIYIWNLLSTSRQ